MNAPARSLLTRKDEATLCSVSTDSIRRWERKGLLPAVKINARATRYREDDVSRLVSSNTSHPAAAATVEDAA